jgi:DNA-binding GntR family transcriptional regulator
MRLYRIGRTPFREACNRLHHEALLQAVPRHGYLIPEISFQSVRDLFEVRLILEAAIAEFAAVRATDGEIGDLRKLASEAPAKAGLENESVRSIIEANVRFHLQLAKTARNRNLLELLTRNLEAGERLMYLELRSSRFRDREFQLVHGRIVDALETRDPRTVRDAVLDDIIQAQHVIFAFGKSSVHYNAPLSDSPAARSISGFAAEDRADRRAAEPSHRTMSRGRRRAKH